MTEGKKEVKVTPCPKCKTPMVLMGVDGLRCPTCGTKL